MFNRFATQTASFAFAAFVTLSTLAGIDALATQGQGATAQAAQQAVQQVVITAKRLPAA